MKAFSKLICSVSAIALGAALSSIASAQQASSTVQSTNETASSSGTESLLEEIIVTGSSIRGVQPIGSNLIDVSRHDIEILGAATTADLLATVPQLNSFNTVPKPALGGFGSYAPGMRGLPASATLPLMNGHRLVAGGANETNPDYPLLPSLAIERVEVVADGASSIYGSDAVAGVVNFITRKNFDGAEISFNYGTADNYDSFSVNGLIGQNWGTGSIMAAYQYNEHDNIVARDRDYRVRDFSRWGGIDTRDTSCASPNMVVDSTSYAINHAYPELEPGTINYCDNAAAADLIPRSRLHSVFLSGHQDLNDRATFWGEILYSDLREDIRAALPSQAVWMSDANPFFQAPAGSGATTAYVQFRPDNLVGADHFDSEDKRTALNSSLGVDYRLEHDLNLSVYGTYGRAKNDAYIPAINPYAIAAAGVGTTADTALDPFGQGTSPEVIAAILDFATDVNIEQVTRVGAVKLDGPLMDLPGGEMKFAIGTEYRHESFEQRGSVGPSPVPEDLSRNVKSVYAELFVPIIGYDNALPFVQSLHLSLSGRYDKYSDFGSTSNPKIGINWDPIDGLTIRGSYGTSFRAPGLRQVGATVGAYYLTAAEAVAGAYDPARGADQVETVYLLGGNRDLQPEEATTYSLGFDVNPSFLPDLRASLTYYNIEYTEVIGTPPTDLVFTDPTFSAIVHRDISTAELNSLLASAGAVPVNLISDLSGVGNFLDMRLNNFGIRETDGLDFDLNYLWPTDFGSVFARLSGNYILNWDTRNSPAAPVSDNLRLGMSRWTARASVGIDAGSISMMGFVNHQDGITNIFATPTGVSSYKSDSYTTVDLRVSWALPSGGFMDGTVLGFHVNNLFDEDPAFFPANDGIGGNYNPIGRYLALDLRKSF